MQIANGTVPRYPWPLSWLLVASGGEAVSRKAAMTNNMRKPVSVLRRFLASEAAGGGDVNSWNAIGGISNPGDTPTGTKAGPLIKQAGTYA